MIRTRREFLKVTGAGLAAAAAGPALAPRPARAQQLTPFKIGSVVLGDMGDAGPILVGIEKGFFRQNGIAAEMVPFKGGPDQLKGVLAGAVSLALSGSTDVLVFRAAGTKVRDVATTTEKNHFTLTVGPKIQKLEDLKGGTIGCTVVGSTTRVFARMLAKKMGWDPEKDVRIVGQGGFDSLVAGMRRGELQAFVFGDAGAVAEYQGVGKVLMRMDEVTPRWISQMAYATEETIATRKDDLHKVLRGLFQAMKFMRENPEETIQICAKGIGWPVPAARRAYEIVHTLLPVDGHIDLEAYKIMQDTLLELGVLKKRLPLEEHYDLSFTPVKI
jgi:NitT/TauT family transport system substrate-binding protein